MEVTVFTPITETGSFSVANIRDEKVDLQESERISVDFWDLKLGSERISVDFQDLMLKLSRVLTDDWENRLEFRVELNSHPHDEKQHLWKMVGEDPEQWMLDDFLDFRLESERISTVSKIFRLEL